MDISGKIESSHSFCQITDYRFVNEVPFYEESNVEESKIVDAFCATINDNYNSKQVFKP